MNEIELQKKSRIQVHYYTVLARFLLESTICWDCVSAIVITIIYFHLRNHFAIIE